MRAQASKQERGAVAVDGRCGLLSCYWQAALSALTGEREIDFGLRTRCFIALHQRSRFVRADTVGQVTVLVPSGSMQAPRPSLR
jgi:hypothetical protein